MDWMYLFYFLLAGLIFFGSRGMERGAFNEEYTSLRQTKVLQGISALGIALHHMAQKTCAPWHPRMYMVHGLDFFLSLGYMFVGVFLFCSGMGLYKRFKTDSGYLKGFFRRRILPVIVAFYLSEMIYTVVRLLMGEKMDSVTAVWYLSGLHMANFNAWYVIVIPFFYLAFWAAFRFCRREGAAILLVFLFTLGYAVLGAFIGHQDDWWMQGEWWYNSILLFPVGLLFAKYEAGITRVLKKGYRIWLPLSLAAVILLFLQSEWLNNGHWGYYDSLRHPMRIPHSLMSAGVQWAVCIAFTAFCFLLMMKIKLGNRALDWLGALTLDFYLMHGMFVEFFGYNFLDISRSLVYIRNVLLYILTVLACSLPASLLFRAVRTGIVNLTCRRSGKNTPSSAGENPSRISRPKSGKMRKSEEKSSKLRRFLVPGITLLLLAGLYFLYGTGSRDDHVRVMNGMEFRVPEGFSLQHGDSENAVWKYTGKDRKAGYLILDAEIPDPASRHLHTLESVYEECDWLTDKEMYSNPQSVRMLRCYADYSGRPELRYYIESPRGLMLMRMAEDDRYYSTEDCEETMRRTADSVRRVR